MMNLHKTLDSVLVLEGGCTFNVARAHVIFVAAEGASVVSLGGEAYLGLTTNFSVFQVD